MSLHTPSVADDVLLNPLQLPSHHQPKQSTAGKNSFTGAVFHYGGSVFLSIIVLFLSMHLWNANLRVPFNYTADGKDAFFNMMQVKTVIETGWAWHNPLLGAPGSLDLLDFPNPETLHTAAIHAISWCTHDFGLALNLYFLLTFPLVALTTTIAARQIGLGPATSVLVAQLYTFLPFHFMRGEMHLALAAYYALPLTVPVMLAIAGGTTLGAWRWVMGCFGFVMAALSSPYYAAFAGFFLGVAGVAAFVQRRDRKAVHAAIVIGFLLFAVFFVQLIPSLKYSSRFGANPMVGARVLYEGDLYGLRLTQMLLPVPGHRISALAEFRDQFAAHAPLVNENESSALGIVASWGVLILLFHALFGSRESENASQTRSAKMLKSLALLLLAGFLLATVGGIGPTLNYLGITVIRGYNRVSIYLGLFALLAVGIAIDRPLKACKSRLRWTTCALILVLGLLDQISPRNIPQYDNIASEFKSDAKFVATIEAGVPAGASIFQLPVMGFPESAPINGLADYQLFRGYLQSSTLHWSYGAMKGRPVSDWQNKIAAMPVQTLLETLHARGFSGVYLDRLSFHDREMELDLQSHLGPPIVSDNGRLLFFKMASH